MRSQGLNYCRSHFQVQRNKQQSGNHLEDTQVSGYWGGDVGSDNVPSHLPTRTFAPPNFFVQNKTTVHVSSTRDVNCLSDDSGILRDL